MDIGKEIEVIEVVPQTLPTPTPESVPESVPEKVPGVCWKKYEGRVA